MIIPKKKERWMESEIISSLNLVTSVSKNISKKMKDEINRKYRLIFKERRKIRMNKYIAIPIANFLYLDPIWHRRPIKIGAKIAKEEVKTEKVKKRREAINEDFFLFSRYFM